MTNERDKEFGFAPSYDAPIPYLQRIRSYYQALGYGAPLALPRLPARSWAHCSPYSAPYFVFKYERYGLIDSGSPVARSTISGAVNLRPWR